MIKTTSIAVDAALEMVARAMLKTVSRPVSKMEVDGCLAEKPMVGETMEEVLVISLRNLNRSEL